ncbi:efflux transporter outer membrane subunit [Rugamonas apoptosis]|uniref:Efflux transporter outer membrane subunit n=1 Tax=Rugamonas apoptosis TaxID=2758570 RepID=A0A7W2FE52_9BURK|nr:efflux transporter outer membrane subunit [Rugamonas apoptosis]MBA5690043.1 efflux transporter outer membrane subunit [Rugamonas apoptosis]
MQAIRIAAAATLALTLAACADMGGIAPQAHKLDATSVNAGAAIKGAMAHAAWPQEQWWEALQDPQLNRLMASALADNPSLHAAQARVRQARALAGITEAATLPRVDAAASAQRELFSAHAMVPPPLAGNYAWNNTAILSGSYDLDLWGRDHAALAAALGDVQLASAETQMARLALESAIVRAYIQLALNYTLEDSAAATLAQRERLLDLTRRRQAAGLASAIDVTSIETTLPAGRREQEQIGTTIALLRNQLAALIGKGPGDGESIARPRLILAPEQGQTLPATAASAGVSAAALPIALPAELPAELLGRRPDIAAQRWRVEAAAQRINVAKAAFYPNINLTAFAGVQALGFGHLLEAGSAMRGIAPAISLPVFEGGRLRSQLAGQSAVYDGAVEQYNATVLHALEEVANAVTRDRAEQEQARLNRQALASARQAHRLAEQAWRAGLTDQANEIGARIALLQEQRQVAQVASRQLDNYAELMAALGGGVKLDLP